MDSQSRQSGPAYLRGMPGSSWAGATAAHRPLSDQTRVNVTRWAEEYISRLRRVAQPGHGTELARRRQFQGTGASQRLRNVVSEVGLRTLGPKLPCG
jgi:hypothetical protein